LVYNLRDLITFRYNMCDLSHVRGIIVRTHMGAIFIERRVIFKLNSIVLYEMKTTNLAGKLGQKTSAKR